MSIDQLSNILDEIKGYVDDYKVIKKENNQLSGMVVPLKEQIAQLQATISEKRYCCYKNK